LSDHEVLLNLVDRASDFLKKNGLHILVAVLVIALAAVLLRTAYFRRVAQANIAWSVLAALPESPALSDDLTMGDPAGAAGERQNGIAECRRLLEGPETSATPWLLYKLGNLQAAARDWESAVSAYERLLRDYPDSGAADAAQAAMATALEDAGDYRRAAPAYERAASVVADLYLVDAGRAWELAAEAASAERCYNAALAAGLDPRLEELVTGRLREVREGNLLSAPPPRPVPDEADQSDLGPLLVPADTAAAPADSE
jgi:tetratricopeptide (TPR) repeat protein